MIATKRNSILTVISLSLLVTSCGSSDDVTSDDITSSVINASEAVVTLRKANATSFSIDGGADASYNQSINLISFDSFSSDQQWLELDRGNGYYSYCLLYTSPSPRD